MGIALENMVDVQSLNKLLKHPLHYCYRNEHCGVIKTLTTKVHSVLFISLVLEHFLRRVQV